MYHEQRRWFAGTNAKPQNVWATRTGTEANLTSSLPSRDADGMELRAAAEIHAAGVAILVKTECMAAVEPVIRRASTAFGFVCYFFHNLSF
jgi:hypothetical protein